MPKAPDWLLNWSATQPNLIDDSPQFRQKETEMQRNNLVRATNQALRAVNQRTQDMAIDTGTKNLEMMHQMMPIYPLVGPYDPYFEENDVRSRKVPTDAEFDTQPIVEPSPMDPMQQDTRTQMPEDPSAVVQQIADTLGLTPQQVASMALLGQDISNLESEQNPQLNRTMAEEEIPYQPNRTMREEEIPLLAGDIDPQLNRTMQEEEIPILSPGAARPLTR